MIGARRHVELWSIVVLACLAAPACAEILLYVDDSAPAGGDGSAWNTAFADLQDALDAAWDADDVVTLHVGHGVYRPDRGTGQRSATFELPGGLVLRGGFAGFGAPDPDLRDPAAISTTLEGDLLGNDGSDEATRADNAFHVVSVILAGAPVELDGVRIRGGESILGGNQYEVGGGIRCLWSDLVLRDSMISACRASEGGGIGALLAGSVTLIGSTISGCHATLQGGAVRLADGAMSIEESTLTGNTSDSWGGGAIMLENCVLEATDSTFEGNVSSSGGAIYALDSELALTRVVLKSNSCVSGSGRAMWWSDSDLDMIECMVLEQNISGNHTLFGSSGRLLIDACTIRNNASYNSLPVVSINTDTAVVRDTHFLSNGGGDGLRISGTDLEVVGCRFEFQTTGAALSIGSDSGNAVVRSCEFVSNSGGAIDVDVLAGATALVEGCEFSGNARTAAKLDGSGAIVVRDCTFTDNTSNGDGGSMRIWGTGERTLLDCTFVGGGAAASGGAVHAYVAAVSILGCSFSGAQAGSGGFIQLKVCSGTIADCSFVGGLAHDWGGAIHLEECHDVRIDRCRVLGNRVVQVGELFVGGGGIGIDDCTNVVVANSVIAGNVATTSFTDGRGGGGLRIRGDLVRLDGTTIARNHSGHGAGGLTVDASSVDLTNAIVVQNTSGEGTPLEQQVRGLNGGAVEMRFGVVQGVDPDNAFDLFDADPHFVDADGPDGVDGTADDDYHLAVDSPAIDRGDPDAATSPDDLDLDGEPRVQDCRRDLGADERPSPHDCNANGVPDACDLLDGIDVDCDANGVPDSCDIAAGADDCDGDGVPDACQLEVAVRRDSGQMGPFSSLWPQTWTPSGLPAALGGGLLTIEVVGDFDLPDETVTVRADGVALGTLFAVTGNDCPAQPDAAAIALDAATMQALTMDGVVVLELVPSATVSNACSGQTWARAILEYTGRGPADADGDGVIDACVCPADLDGGGDVGFGDLLLLLEAWGPCDASCATDLDDDGVTGLGDLLVVLSAWGPC